jgi:hypothetical protein
MAARASCSSHREGGLVLRLGLAPGADIRRDHLRLEEPGADLEGKVQFVGLAPTVGPLQRSANL